jgi:hypothetical protein
LLSDAIRYSIKTEGCVLNKKLKDKATEFGDDPQETYLRITLGHSLGKSPGIPYVLEIWPKSNYSPIHNHGNNEFCNCFICANVIKIWPVCGVATVVFVALNRCAVIIADILKLMCLVPISNTTHWPYFDYISANETIAEFIPNSDFEFQEIRNQVMAEYKKHKKY